MKKGILLVLAFVAISFTVEAQRFCYVDVDKVLESVEEYKAAQNKLDQFASKWNQEIAQKYKEIDELYRKYQADKVLLPEAAQQQREEEIIKKENEAREFQKQKFGPEGELFQKRQELVKPIQDKVYTAIEEYAQKRGYDFIFDRSSTPGMLFANPEMDKTEDIINSLPKE
jgi:outer membrane protein